MQSSSKAIVVAATAIALHVHYNGQWSPAQVDRMQLIPTRSFDPNIIQARRTTTLQNKFWAASTLRRRNPVWQM